MGSNTLNSDKKGTVASRSVRHIALLVSLMLVWEALVAINWIDPLVLPSPSSIVAATWDIAISSGLVWSHFGITLYEAVVGFILGSIFGVSLAIAAALSTPFRRYISPYIVALQVTPRIALAPVIIAWLGFGTTPMIGIAALVCFFPPFVNTLTGLLDVDSDVLEMFRSLRASKRQIFLKAMLPNAMPMIMAGLKTAVSMALIGAIVGEFISASQGLGVLMQRFTFALNMSASFAALLLLTLMGLILFAITEWADNKIVYWRHDERLNEISKRKYENYKKKNNNTGSPFQAVAAKRNA